MVDELACCVVVTRAARLAVSVRSLVSSLWCSCVDGLVSSGASENIRKVGISLFCLILSFHLFLSFSAFCFTMKSLWR